MSNLYRLPIQTIEEALDMLPAQLLTILGNLDIPRDGGTRMAEAIDSGQCVGASDGSMEQSQIQIEGGHGYALFHWNDDNNAIEGRAPTPTTDAMSSMTTEH